MQSMVVQHVMNKTRKSKVRAPNAVLSAANASVTLPNDPQDLEMNPVYSDGDSGVSVAVALPRSGRSQMAAWVEIMSTAALFNVAATAVPLMCRAFEMSREE
ncbi:hypothetical protein H310_00996 [Aphanomyces invadans]|uniref:Uncharacterized protein n=1 Tax=Aphanomyces invadans TaxID=157072 RepID=A0A024UPT8_9STRA|nr:hypothetical protein H310_00996 [Aphanomyces invadans]ETW08411.1 hypothetical protein H310_00996 [Aphanomyces invadans]|eukprot:XP_008862216.1 hypothetical protein H310_00996 [Aphanomyces invadans]